MSKINFNTENPEIEITRAIGKKSDGKITLNTEGGSIEVDLGFASLGATTDYGGAVSVGLLGQEITWGREGGTIHIGIGGFTVDVEARDCIVTEVKSIFGIIVAQRSYPDPGCKLPEPLPPPLPEPLPPPPGSDGTDQLKPGIGWVFCKARIDYSHIFNISGYPDIFLLDEGFNQITVTSTNYNLDAFGRLDLTTCRASGEVDFTTSLVSGNPPPNWYNTEIGNVKAKSSSVSAPPFRVATSSGVVTLYEFLSYTTTNIIRTPSTYIRVLPTGTRGWLLHGEQLGIKEYIQKYNSSAAKRQTRSREIMQVIKVVPIKQTQSLAPFLPTGNKPPMQNCCEDILDMLEDIKEAYAVDRILKDKFPVSNVFMAPECDPASQTIAKNFYEILQCLFRTLAHGLIFEPRVSIKDADAAKAGDQEFKAKYLNATGWASAVAEALLEVKDDGNVSTNMDIRNGFAVTQTMVGLADAIYRLNAILDGIGVELIPITETIDTPYNLQIQIGKGFGEGNERQIDLNTDEATEKLLPAMLRVKSNKIKTVDIHPRSRSLKEILENIELNLSSNSNG